MWDKGTGTLSHIDLFPCPDREAEYAKSEKDVK